MGDADGDGDVDGDDFLTWQSQFGNVAGSGSNTAVPEPAAAMLAGLCGLAILGLKRFRGGAKPAANRLRG